MTTNDEITWTIGPSSGDTEVDAMRQMLVLLRPLTYGARRRVLRWVAERIDDAEPLPSTLLDPGSES